MDVADRDAALEALDFGKVDAESELDLEQRFVRTADFDELATQDIWIALGPKGTGKSALFEVFAKHEALARRLAPGDLERVILTTGTGFGDLSELATGDIERLSAETGYDHDKLWRLYVAVRAGMGIAAAGVSVPNGPLRDLLRALGEEPDRRVLPVMKSLWKTVVGDAPSEISIASRGATVTIRGGKRALDVISLLQYEQEALEAAGKTLWIFFDKVDEIFPANPTERRSAIEGLMTAAMAIRRQFPAIQPKILLRTDIWQDLRFTNKSHLSDKRVLLSWSEEQLAVLLLKRACVDPLVQALVEAQVPSLVGAEVEALTRVEVETGLKVIFPEKVYPGEREADIVDWIVARVTDAQGTVLPRETIMLGNRAQVEQMSLGGRAADSSLLSREAVREAFTYVSNERVSSYLAEFPDVEEHLKRFRGQQTSNFTRDALEALMDGLEPSGIDLLDRLFEIGVLEPMKGTTVTAESFEIPRLTASAWVWSSGAARSVSPRWRVKRLGRRSPTRAFARGHSLTLAHASCTR